MSRCPPDVPPHPIRHGCKLAGRRTHKTETVIPMEVKLPQMAIGDFIESYRNKPSRQLFGGIVFLGNNVVDRN